MHEYSIEFITAHRSMSNRRGRLRLLKGGTVLLPARVPLGDNLLPEDLLFSCLAALVPPTRPGELIDARTHCSHVHVMHVYMYIYIVIPGQVTACGSSQ